jgi:hypothetical protein
VTLPRRCRILATLLVLVVGCGGAPTTDEPSVVGDGFLPFEPAAEVWSLSGDIDLTTEQATLERARTLPARVAIEAGDGGPFELVLEGAGGDEIRTIGFLPEDPSAGEEPLAFFQVELELPLEPLTRASVRYEGQRLGARDAGASVPTVRIVSPAPGEELSVTSDRLAWEAQDADGDELTFSVLLSVDGGERYRSLGTTVTGTELVLADLRNEVPPSDAAHLVISVTDGLNSSWASSELFTLRSACGPGELVAGHRSDRGRWLVAGHRSVIAGGGRCRSRRRG